MVATECRADLEKLNCERKEGSTAHWWMSEELGWVHICRVVKVNKVSGRLDGAII